MNRVDSNQFLSIEQLHNQYFSEQTVKKQTVADSNFSTYLEKAKNQETSTEVHFSKHASNRLQERNISLTEEQLKRLEEGTLKASGKGIKDSLVLVDQLAFIVNVPNKTVVTAMDSTQTDEFVFTNIDGAVIN